MKASFVFLVSFISNQFCLHAQNTLYLEQGKITYEKKENNFAWLDGNDMDANRKQALKESMPQFKQTYFDLFFKNGQTLWKPAPENQTSTHEVDLFADLAAHNIVFTNLNVQNTVSEKKNFEQTYLIEDSTRKITWKFTDETRNIAGFECRRANALIMDSVYVIAFFTTDILTGGGPESFTGLPGMILGVVIPHEHITWFATKIYNEPITDLMLIPPVAGKKETNLTLLNDLKNTMRTWGKAGLQVLKRVML